MVSMLSETPRAEHTDAGVGAGVGLKRACNVIVFSDCCQLM